MIHASTDMPLEDLLVKLHLDDPAAAEQIFATYEPFLRLLVRRQLSHALRSKFDSVDVVQSVWVDLLRDFRRCGCRFASSAHLRNYLVRATRNRFIDRLRKDGKARALEQPLGSTRPADLPVAVSTTLEGEMEADDIWTELLGLCPPAHRELLRLKREGCTLAEIATRTGLHAGSVRRILYELARRFAMARRRKVP